MEPRLWNIVRAGILRLRETEKATLIGFVDDLAEVEIARHPENVKVHGGEKYRAQC